MTAADLRVPRAIVRHGATPLVDVVDLHLGPGRPLTVVGESGSGKSLLAHALMGTLAPELEATGEMSVGDRRFDLADRRGRRQLWGRHLALLPQEPALALDPTMRVRGQVAEGVAGWRPWRREALRVADARLDRLGLGHVGAAYPHTLSGGMAQRVAFAAATVGGARVLVVDEPTTGLDEVSVDRLVALLDAHVVSGGLLLTITHDLRLARRLGGDVAVMRDAAVVERGPAERVLDAPAHPYSRSLVAAEPSHWAKPWQRRSGGASEAPGETTPLVAVRGLTKAYGDQRLFTDLHLAVSAGERWALTGASGAGKSTLGDVLLGVTAPDAGEVRRAPGAAGRLQKLYQDPALSFPRRVPLGAGLDDVARRHRAASGRLYDLVERVGLDPALLTRRPDQVSGGELQRVAVVRAMLTRPALVVADEATSRLDLVTQESTVDVLLGELAASGCALVAVTHDRDLAAAVADREVALEGGTAQVREVVPAR